MLHFPAELHSCTHFVYFMPHSKIFSPSHVGIFVSSHFFSPPQQHTQQTKVNSSDYRFTQLTTQQHRWPAPGSSSFSSSSSTRERKMEKQQNRDECANVWKHNGRQPEGKDQGLHRESRLGNQLEHFYFAHTHTWCRTILWFMFPSWKAQSNVGNVAQRGGRKEGVEEGDLVLYGNHFICTNKTWRW